MDSGFRPGKATAGDEHRVYEFALRFPRWVFATKGHDAQTTPLRPSKIEVLHTGKKAKSSLTLIHLDTDFFKSLVHSRVRMEIGRPGSFHLPLGAEDAGMMSGGITEDYARQIVSEGRVINPANGKVQWIKRFKDNHFLDCEAMAAAAGYILRVQTIKEGVQRSGEDAEQVVVEQPRAATPPKQKQPDQQPQQAEPQELQRRPRDPWLSAEGGGQRRKGWL